MTGLAATEPAGNSGALPKLGLRFAIGYVVVAAVLFSIYGFPFELFGAHSDWLGGYLRMYARLAGSALRLFESGIVVTGDRIDGRFSLQIVRNCDAIEVNILFASAILAFPAPWLRRSVALAGGLALLVLANIARICLLYFVGVYQPNWFKAAHEEIMPLLLIALTALSFLFWARYLTRPSRERAAPIVVP
ncbi:MAG TPA: archaeosortase/exosortase family protein [Polyangiaceae bacterium]|jgi:exosortase/archaeosortase family protein